MTDFKGKSYFFYHTGKLGGGFGHSVAVEEFKYNADGTFPIDVYKRQSLSCVQDIAGIFEKWWAKDYIDTVIDILK